MRDLNQDSSSSSSQHEDKPSRHLSDGFTLHPVNGYFEYNKEIIKQTMLEHEATFREQLYELHHLYGVQKELMDELKMKEFLRYSVPTGTSQSNSLSSQVPFEGAKIKWQMSQVPVVSNFCSVGSVAESSHTRPSQNFLKYNNNTEVFTNGMFDLKLPADVYNKSEETERAQREDVTESSFGATDLLNKVRKLEPEDNVKLTLGLCEDPYRNATWKPIAKSQNNLPTRMSVDLNDPVIDTHYEGSSDPCMEFFQELLSADGGVTKRHWRPLDNGSGPSQSASSFNSDFIRKTFPMSYEAIKSKLKRTRGVILSDQNYTETVFREKLTNGVDISGRRPDCANSSYLLQSVSPPVPGPFPISPHMDFQADASPALPSPRTHTNGMRHSPLAVQALPCSNGSTIYQRSGNSEAAFQNSGISYGKWHYHTDKRLEQTFDHESSSYQNGFHLSASTHGNPNLTVNSYESYYGNSGGHGPQNFFKGSQGSGAKSKKDMNLIDVLQNGTHDGYIAPRNHKEASGSLSLLKMASACNKSADLERHASQMLGFSQGYSHPFSSSHTVASDILMRCEKEKGSSLHIRKDSLSDWRAKEMNLINFNRMMFQGAEKFGNNPIAFNKNIDPNLDTPESLETACEDAVNVLAPPSLPNIATKTTFKIDLDAPIPSQAKENVLPWRKFMSRTAESQERKCSQDGSIMAAAENIIVLSRGVHFHLDRHCSPSEPVSCHNDSLHWFAEVVSSSAESIKGFVSVSDDEGSDSFVSSTLKLEETKMDEYWCRPQEQESRKDEDKRIASLLTRPRRGRARRRRRDFQKEILPGLASLSRNEITEDLRALGGMMKAAGITWHTRLTRRSSGKRPQRKAATVAETRVSPPPPPNNVELDKAEDVYVTGRGRATRRCRRQR